MSKIKKLLILDRDETLNEDPGYLKDPEKVRLKEKVGESLALLQNMGYEFVVATNQAGIAKGLLSWQELQKVNEKIEELLLQYGVKIRNWYICPHKDEDNCTCRKPKPGLIKEILNKEPFKKEDIYLVGDRLRDIFSGEIYDIPGILILSKETEKNFSQKPKNLLYVANSFSEAVGFILQRDFNLNFEKKIFPNYQDPSFLSFLKDIEKAQKKIVTTNGCFDILHMGHLQYLWQASLLGDIFIVALNADDSVKKLKGPSRPINTFWDRAFLLAGFDFITAVVGFSEENPISFLNLVHPHIHVKGGDYIAENLPEYPVVKKHGGEIFILPFRMGYSTTNLIQKIKG